ncbi:HNH endonuclease signature motif containing protein [Serratia marcescens]|uniref:HNH endonuclease signature motif containing protein n=1 Tax=Serratia marcescens TaxID=615 RepID=UPI00274C9C84|nr:HNH endonuclease signature motif containing protein [Serratia marcescens]MDP8626893.1 HNH endonuclease signature motif containing protein [Serratia marcescens]MDP8676327.1 HNH endonuclease signature motif containing protein [Serratia marcescens]MDP8691330.1 HNH endonuclease signature motif containing protein [Serratia marcescens]MDP8700987.1 HNH endonuclease signature motif containing protein [Serratia marcescens]MDP8710753.1 HNH endonuclease signature motif containing protein [Serratia mar
MLTSTRNSLDISFLHECFDCDFSSGILTWKKRPVSHHKNENCFKRWNARFEGKKAGWVGVNGYSYITIDNKKYLAHRIIWALKYGAWPEEEIDHIDGCPGNNAAANLRSATGAENKRNKSLQRNNKSGCHGVIWHKRMGKWHASIQFNGEYFNLGFFSDLGAAVRVRKDAEKRFNYHPNHGTR